MILIITSKTDGHVGPVTEHLDRADVPWVRMNTEDFAENVVLTVSPVEGRGTLYMRDSGKTVDLSAVSAVWYRKPEPPSVGHFELDAGALDYVQAELNEILLGVYALLGDAKWINDPFTTRIAHRKMLQLQVAREVGFRTPKSLITNDPEAALAFTRSIGKDLAIKSLGAISVVQSRAKGAVQYGIFTRRVGISELDRVKDKIRFMPTLFQEFVEKRYELRITCVGPKVFACRIEARAGDLTADDYRFDTKNLRHEPCSVPELGDMLRAYMIRFGLNFGCFDVMIDEGGHPVFCECNPNGQWLWVEKLTGLPISQAIAAELLCREVPIAHPRR